MERSLAVEALIVEGRLRRVGSKVGAFSAGIDRMVADTEGGRYVGSLEKVLILEEDKSIAII